MRNVRSTIHVGRTIVVEEEPMVFRDYAPEAGWSPLNLRRWEASIEVLGVESPSVRVEIISDTAGSAERIANNAVPFLQGRGDLERGAAIVTVLYAMDPLYEIGKLDA